MRQIVLDTETTGLEWRKGNRVVEIGCVELVERRPTGRTWQQYIHPGREFEPGAQEVTGLTLEFLADKPKFAAIVDEFLAFIDGAELVIHNAAFDLGFLDHELSLLGDGYGRIRDRAAVLDSLEMARQRFPGQRNSLDALCRRLGVDNSHRQLHGALLDAQLLAEAYLAMTAGQTELGLAGSDTDPQQVAMMRMPPAASDAPRPRVAVGMTDMAAHEARLATIRKRAGRAVWDVEDELAEHATA
ncbi:DNA polymerase III subunit epsilon [Luteimonas sp. MC1782]|uniref:DNA polymerase III subunit epsilon n=1 Tax=Luteimonas sp. MC1782 TaxID=2760305 RepID=UPI0015FF74E3|nr:DNA polymerase III subunit epsilon [Luteimonas sp. MC1782]MBB1471489.1 DNA polymerase III subunit epsilon [Luteimonas sp. MC1782]